MLGIGRALAAAVSAAGMPVSTAPLSEIRPGGGGKNKIPRAPDGA